MTRGLVFTALALLLSACARAAIVVGEDPPVTEGDTTVRVDEHEETSKPAPVPPFGRADASKPDADADDDGGEGANEPPIGNPPWSRDAGNDSADGA